MTPRQANAWIDLQEAVESFLQPDPLRQAIDPRGPGALDWVKAQAQAFLNSLS